MVYETKMGAAGSIFELNLSQFQNQYNFQSYNHFEIFEGLVQKLNLQRTPISISPTVLIL